VISLAMAAGLPRSGVFAVDVAATCAAAWLLVCAFGLRDRGILEVSVAWWLSLSALAGGAGVVLGETGGLGTAGFLAVHASTLASLLALRRHSLSSDLSALGRVARDVRRFLDGRSFESVATLGLLLVLALLAVVSAWSEPATADALSYHLPRIGQWLQDGRVTVIASQDERMNFVATVTDLVSAWLVGGSAIGFRPSDLVQAIGGIMAVGATVGLARQTGLGRGASVLAGALLFGMANVVVQFAASQTDLFTAGAFSAAFYLWICALRRGEGSGLAGIGAGLALGAKGTIFYLAPGAAVWVAFAAWRHPLPWARWGRTLAAAALGFALFALPGFARNWRAYGDALGPKEWVAALHKGARSPSEFLEKLQWNLTCTLAQVFEPQSQPVGLRGVGRSVVAELEQHVPAKDPYTLYGMGRRERMQNAFLHKTEPDAEFTSFGIVAFALFAAGTVAALARWRRADAQMVASWSAGVLVFLLFFDAMQQWHPYAFRYFVLAAPWIAVVSAWGIEQLRGGWRLAAWTAVLFATADVGWRVTADTYQAGWRAVVDPGQSLTYFASKNWGDWSTRLEPGAAPLSIFLPEGAAVAGFYRNPVPRRIAYIPGPAKDVSTAEDYVRGEPGWVVVRPPLFLGHEGRVAASIWLYNGDVGSPFSVAAYRRLKAGEEPRPMIYGDARSDGPRGPLHQLLVKTWDGRPTEFKLTNPCGVPIVFVMISPLSSESGTIPALGHFTIPVVLPADRVSEVKITFEFPVPAAPDAPDPSIAL
jgi:hypothetical protein